MEVGYYVCVCRVGGGANYMYRLFKKKKKNEISVGKIIVKIDIGQNERYKSGMK